MTCLKLPDPAYKALNPSLIFNLSLEPALVYNLSTFADKGSDENYVGGRTSFRLQDSVLYLETDDSRFEISKNKNGNTSTYRVAQVLDPYFKDNEYMMRQGRRRPLVEEEEVKVVEGEVEW